MRDDLTTFPQKFQHLEVENRRLQKVITDALGVLDELMRCSMYEATAKVVCRARIILREGLETHE